MQEELTSAFIIAAFETATRSEQDRLLDLLPKAIDKQRSIADETLTAFLAKKAIGDTLFSDDYKARMVIGAIVNKCPALASFALQKVIDFAHEPEVSDDMLNLIGAKNFVLQKTLGVIVTNSNDPEIAKIARIHASRDANDENEIIRNAAQENLRIIDTKFPRLPGIIQPQRPIEEVLQSLERLIAP